MNRFIAFALLCLLSTPAVIFAQSNEVTVFNLDNAAEETGLSRNLTAGISNNGNAKILSLDAWNGECAVSIQTDRNSIFYLKPDSNLEWEITLDRKPESPLLSYSLISRGLSFYYQPILTGSEIADGAFRPDSVVGSYAVYHQNRRGNRINSDGQSEKEARYGCGKAFHIYAPYAWDYDGDTVKCSLYIDIESSILEIHLPVKFLDEAAYPVTVDPQFGNSTAGETSFLLNPNYSAGGLFTSPADGTIDSICIYLVDDGVYGTIGGAVYSDDGGCDAFVDSTTGTFAITGNGWYQMKAAEESAIVDGAAYWILAYCGASAYYLKYDTQIGANAIRDFNDPWPPLNPCNPPTWSYPDRLLSMYVTYIAGQTPESGNSRRRQILIEQGGNIE